MIVKSVDIWQETATAWQTMHTALQTLNLLQQVLLVITAAFALGTINFAWAKLLNWIDAGLNGHDKSSGATPQRHSHQ